MKYLFVGDLHGRHEAVDRAVAAMVAAGCDKLIFMGDIFDSFDRTVRDQFITFQMVKTLVESGFADCVWANHEWSYLHNGMSCSGYNYATYARRHEFELTVRRDFKPYLWLDGQILVTHAGLTGHKFTRADIQNLDEWSRDYDSPYFKVGRSRGGRSEYGGPLWCDFKEDFIPIPGLTQVFGHSHGPSIRRVEESYCIDCISDTAKDDEFLVLET